MTSSNTNPEIFRHGPFGLEVERFGSGNDVLLAFHGFGRTLDDFKTFNDSLGKRYHIHGFNLFHHGNAEYPSDRIHRNTISKAEFREVLEAYLDANGIDRFSLLAYSIGGRVALCMMEWFPERIDRVFLFAPDGIKINGWYKLASYSAIGRLLYRGLIWQPWPFFFLLDVAAATGIIRKKLRKFVRGNMESKAKREQVYNVWMTMRAIEPDLQAVRQFIVGKQDDVRLYFGKYDRIIPPHIGESLLEPVDAMDCLVVVEDGHNLITPKMSQRLRTELKLPEHG